MKAFITEWFVLIVLSFVLSGLISFTNAADKEKTFSVSKGDQLVVSVSNGNITISPWNKDQAHITVKNIDEDDLNDLKIEQHGNKVIVEFNGQDSDDFVLEVFLPENFNLDLSSGAGNITFNGKILGKVDVSTGGGNVKLQDVGDRLSVSTGGGNISVGNIFAETEIVTGGGNINIGDIKSRTEVSTGGGNISIGNIGGNVEVSTAGGIISVGKVTGNAELSTAGGNINLEGASGKVEVSTAGGNINLKNISGSVDGNTAGGNIVVELNSNITGNCELNTGGGDISLTLPADAKVGIDANVYVGKNVPESEANKFIKSDFEEATVNFTKGGFNKKFLVNGGGSIIELNTASGKIKINKK
ncbi:MAG: hypothetical protein WAU11_04195 [Ignavibacteriaceae bacterium]